MRTLSIEEFTLGLLQHKGALVESNPGAATVLVGADVAAALGLGEYEQLVFDPALEEPGVVRVDYDSPFLEAMGRLVDSMGRLAFVWIPMGPLKTIDPERELDRALKLQNGVYRFRDCTPVPSTYFCFFLQYDVMADERSGGVAEVWANPSTRSIPQMSSSPLETAEIRDAPAPADLTEKATEAWRLALPAASAVIRLRLRDFIESLKRRRERDLRRMREYYQAIDEEIRRKIHRASSKPDVLKREMSRLEATARSYGARAVEMVDRYRVRVSISGLAALACTIPTYQIRVQLLRRTAKSDMMFSWNPFDRKIEPRCCDACDRPTETAMLCDDRVHYLCPACLSPCPTCSKVFCRACAPRCPRAH